MEQGRSVTMPKNKIPIVLAAIGIVTASVFADLAVEMDESLDALLGMFVTCREKAYWFCVQKNHQDILINKTTKSPPK
jgi:hypothetical protein